jgi:hypothetical protein
MASLMSTGEQRLAMAQEQEDFEMCAVPKQKFSQYNGWSGVPGKAGSYEYTALVDE